MHDEVISLIFLEINNNVYSLNFNRLLSYDAFDKFFLLVCRRKLPTKNNVDLVTNMSAVRRQRCSRGFKIMRHFRMAQICSENVFINYIKYSPKDETIFFFYF